MYSLKTSDLWNATQYTQWIQEGCPKILTVTRIIIHIAFPNEVHIPPEIGNLHNLTGLNISYNAITSIPVEIGKLQNLIGLFLSENAITSLPVEIGNLQNLETLDLSSNKLTSFPAQLGNLINLRSLDLSRNAITSIPVEIGNLQNLTGLNLSENKLTSLPNEIGNLVNMCHLHLACNAVASLPIEIGNLHALETLILRDNRLTSFPPGICNIRNLKELLMSVNCITCLPVEIGNLQNLTCLNLSFNNITSIPTVICNMRNLEALHIICNRLTSLPAEIGDLPNLHTLVITGNEITYIPRNVTRMMERQHCTQGIYGDSQSVHNSTIQKTIKESILRILNERVTHCDVIDLILSDTVLDNFTKESLVEYSGDTSVHTELNLTFHDLLDIVWNRIVGSANSAEIKTVLNIEMRDARCMCFTGRISRLVNCLNGFDPLVTIRISDNEQIGNIISLVKTQLEDKTEYTIERHKEIVRTRLEELGIVAEEIELWLEHIE